MIDLHSHIFPGIDDGSKSWGMTLQMLTEAVREGTTAIAWTPHLLSGENGEYFQTIEQRFSEGLDRIKEWNLPITIYRGGEIYLMPDLSAFAKHPCGTYGGKGKYFLVEFPMYDYHPNYAEVIRRNIELGFGVVIAHPERYIKIQDSESEYRRLKNTGAKLQVNAGSIRGDFGATTQKTAKMLVKKGLADLVASDGHNDDSRPLGLASSYEQVMKWTNRERSEALFVEAPSAVLGIS